MIVEEVKRRGERGRSISELFIRTYPDVCAWYEPCVADLVVYIDLTVTGRSFSRVSGRVGEYLEHGLRPLVLKCKG